MNKKIVIVLACLITGSAMAALFSDKMKTAMLCKDVRIAMDGSLAAGIEVGGLKRHTAVTVYTQKINGKTTLVKQGSVEVFRPFGASPNDRFEKYSGRNLELAVSKTRDQKTGYFPASIRAEIEGKKMASNLLCSPVKN